jgi:hypothetical protein
VSKNDWFEMSLKFESTCIQCGGRLDAGTRHMARTNGTKPNGSAKWEFLCLNCNDLNAGPKVGGVKSFNNVNGSNEGMDILDKARESLAGYEKEMTPEEENNLFGAPEKYSKRWIDQNAVWGRI